jgi:Lon protease-like protein
MIMREQDKQTMKKLTAPPRVLPYISQKDLVLLPQSYTALQVSNPKQKKAVDYALGHGRWLAIIQPHEVKSDHAILYRIGCVGRISTFSEASSGAYGLLLEGVKRFEITTLEHSADLPPLLHVRWLSEQEEDLSDTPQADRNKLIRLLNVAIEEDKLPLTWDEISVASERGLLNAVTAAYPFNGSEKQAILEQNSLRSRIEMMITLLEFNHANILNPVEWKTQ